jgi:hypothetical protein
MACGHQENSRIALHCHPETIFTSLYIQSEEQVANKTKACNNICQPSEDVGSQETEVRSGEMCGPCQVATGEILDDLVRDVNGAQASDGQPRMMAGGLCADSIDFYPENALNGLVRDTSGASASHDQQMEISDGLDADMIDIYFKNALNDFTDGSGGHPMNDASLNTYTMFDGLARDESVRTYENKVTEWLSKADSYEEEAAEYQCEGDFLQSLSKPGDTLSTAECSSCKRFKRRGTLVNFQDHISPVSVFDPSAPPNIERSCPILGKLRSDGTLQDEEGGLLSRVGWVCCEKCGAQMHLL